MYALVKKLIRMLSLFVLITSCVEDNETPFQADAARMNSKVYPQNPQDDKISKALDFINTVFKENEQQTNGAAVQKYAKADITNIFEIADSEKNVRLKLLCFQPNGYALISALENANPLVLWYSKGTLDIEHIHPGLSNYIGEFMEYLKAHPVKENRYATPLNPTYCTPEITVRRRYSVTEQKGPFLTTYWGQLKPFYNQCPKIGNEHCCAGCVPIAIGQIINYHRKDNHKSYNWERMKDIYDPETSAFIHDIGLAVHIKYGLGESGTSDDEALRYFINAGYTYYDLMGYNYITLKKNIDRGDPVYLSGKSGKKGVYFIIRWGWKYYHGHAWVADGYKEVTNYEEVEQRYVCVAETEEEYPYRLRPAPLSPSYPDDPPLLSTTPREYEPRRYTRSSTTHFIHMNWGWGYYYQGKSDGWCTYDYFKPEGKEEYKYKKKMIAFN